MKKIQSASFAVALMFVAGSSAHAAIQIHVAAEVRDGMVFIKGKGAARGAPITWEGGLVATAHNGNGSFSFFGELPDDCTGALSDGNETISVEVRDCTSVIAGAIAPAPLPRTGQIVSEVPGDDGALQKGVALPSPRFTPSHGALSDNLTGLVWIGDLRCPALSQQIGWASAMDVARNFASGMCGLSDGSKPGDWRLPNRNELTSLLDMGRRDPALAAPQLFSGFQVGKYWTSTHFSTPRSGSVWIVDFLDGEVTLGFEGNFRFTILVRDGP